jgi:hypothetical protein
VEYTSENYNDYYYGVSRREANRSGLDRYSADDGWNPYLALTASYEFTQDSSLFSRRLGNMPMVVCAAKKYLAHSGIPDKPADLSNHSWLEYSVRPDNAFELVAPEGLSTKLIPQGRFVTNDPMTLTRWLVAGAGIAYVPLMWVINEINSGELEILFPRYQSDPRPVYALYTEKDKLPLKVQATIATTPRAAVARKDIRQPMVSPSQVAAGTPPILAIVSPINMVATALACLCLGTTLAATTEPRPKKAP